MRIALDVVIIIVFMMHCKHFVRAMKCSRSKEMFVNKVKFSSKKLTTSVVPVICEVINGKGLITLNKPESLNALDVDMIDIINDKLTEWDSKRNVTMVIVRGRGRAFCAGGDVVRFVRDGKKNAQVTSKKQYRMDYLFGSCSQPLISIIDGITMGGGVGISVNGPVRIATERTIVAMPENSIGLYPDVGVSYTLSRLPHQLGQYIGLTGHRLKGIDVVKSGIATHFIDSQNVKGFYEELVNLQSNENLNSFLKAKTKDISDEKFSLEPHLRTIENCFGAPTVEEILQRLEDNSSQFALEALEKLKKMSPISLKISRQLIETSRTKNLQECLLVDNRLTRSAVDARVSKDLYEGVRAVLIDKDQNPRWDPPTLEAVTQEMVDRAFGKLPPEEEEEVKLMLKLI